MATCRIFWFWLAWPASSELCAMSSRASCSLAALRRARWSIVCCRASLAARRGVKCVTSLLRLRTGEEDRSVTGRGGEDEREGRVARAHLSTSSLSAVSLALVCAKIPTTLRFSTLSRSASFLASPTSLRCSSSSPSNRSASSARCASSCPRSASSCATCAEVVERSSRAEERAVSDEARRASRRGISSLTARSSLQGKSQCQQ